MLAVKRTRRLDPDPAFATAFRELAPRLPGSASEPLARIREEGFARFLALGIPTQRDEAWKFINVARIANRPMRPAAPTELPLDRMLPYLLGGPRARRLVFVDGRLQPQWSHTGGLPEGVIVESLARAAETRPLALAEALGELDDGRSFTALNTAFADGGAWIELPAGLALEAPLQLLFVTTGGEVPVMSHPRCILRLGDGASLTLLETHVGLGEGAALTNAVLQITLGSGARLEHDRIELPAAQGSLLAKIDGALGAGARYRQTTVVLGGALVRNEHELRIDGSGAECLLSGVAVPEAGEQSDTLVRIHHRAGGSHSDQYFKHVVEDRGHAAFAGKIIVHPGAQKTNAYQKCDNLLLGDDGEVDTKPELEIYADDVKCSHGATCGELDTVALFYLRSRGLALEAARAILIHAFAAEVIARLADPTARALAETKLVERLGGGLGSALVETVLGEAA